MYPQVTQFETTRLAAERAALLPASGRRHRRKARPAGTPVWLTLRSRRAGTCLDG